MQSTPETRRSGRDLNTAPMRNTATRSVRKAKGEGHLRRAEILLAAEHVFIEYGYEGATIRRIAEAVGVSSTALYMHFTDKSEIVLEICAGQVARLVAAYTELCDRTMDPVERVRAMLSVYTTFARDHPDAYRLVFCAPPHRIGREPREQLAELGARSYALFRDAVSKIAADERLRVGDVEVASQTAWAAIHGMVSLTLVLTRFPWADRATLDAAALDAVFGGLLVMPSA